MITCKCGYKMPLCLATPLKCSCGEPLGTGMFFMVQDDLHDAMLKALGAAQRAIDDGKATNELKEAMSALQKKGWGK